MLWGQQVKVYTDHQNLKGLGYKSQISPKGKITAVWVGDMSMNEEDRPKYVHLRTYVDM